MVERANQRFEVSLKAFLVDRDRLLLVREAGNGRLWELPGGRIDVGEEGKPPEDMLRRELLEELGPATRYEIERPLLTWVRPWEPSRGNGFVFIVGFLCRYLRGDIALSAEHIESA